MAHAKSAKHSDAEKISWKNCKKTKTMYKNDEFTFRLKTNKKKKISVKGVRFSSSDKKVAAVNKKGTVKARKNGTCVITAKKGKRKIKCTVTVRTRVKKINIVGETNTCIKGNTIQLGKDISPISASNKNVKWKSSDNSVASISKSGLITGKKDGKVKITAVAKDGSKKKATVKINVREPLDASAVWISAHRGYHKTYPENSVAAFNEAAKRPFKAIETDVWFTDGFTTETSTAPYPQTDEPQTDEPKTDDDDQENGSENGEEPGQKTKSSVSNNDDPSLDDDDNGEEGAYEDDNDNSPDGDYSDDLSEKNILQYNTVIMHDDTLERMCGSAFPVKGLNAGNIDQFRLKNKKGGSSDQKIPSLTEYLEVMANTDKALIIELKDENITDEQSKYLIDLVDDYGVSERTYFGSFYEKTLLQLRQTLGSRTDIKLTRFVSASLKKDYRNVADWCVRNDIDVYSIKQAYVSKKMSQYVKNSGLEMESWGVNTSNRAYDLMDMGVTRLTTDKILW